MKDASVTLIIGMRGMGKSSKALELVRSAKMPVVVLDPTRSWPRDLKVSPCRSLKEVAAQIKKRWRSNFKIVYVPPPGTEAKALHNLSILLTRVQSGYEAGKHTRQMMLVVEEANLGYPSQGQKPEPNAFTGAILQGRHAGLNLMAVTQRPALVHPNFRGNAQVTYCFAVSDDASRRAVLEVCGTQHRQALAGLKQYEFLEISLGNVTKGKTKKPRN